MTYHRLIFIPTAFLLLFVCTQAYAQSTCLTCESSTDECDVDSGAFIGWFSCDCVPDCSCSVRCYYTNLDTDVLDVLEEKVQVGEVGSLLAQSLPENIRRNMDRAVINGKTADGFYLGEHYGFVEYRDDTTLVFPLQEDQFDFRGCNGEIIASVQRHPSN